LSSPHN